MKFNKLNLHISSKKVYLFTSLVLITSLGLFFSLKKYTEPKFRIQPIDNVPSTNQNKTFISDSVFDRLVSKEWFWTETIIESSIGVRPFNQTSFKLKFNKDLTFSSTSDCNSIGGKYEIFENKIKFKEVVSSQKYCMKSREVDFIEGLNKVSEIKFTDKNELIMIYKDSTTLMRFK